ncbi:stringent starvation protein A [Saccharophagus sp. K07]|jgi:RNA polymerase-associated protein|uniref:glutathione S-transferase N-terminal domain-containing protein n=1 Tax=Saccharophagus sp. K07 TaxID=2283636 RepID=UPI001651B40B|nr:glutathione S-transferase N-terminal domain-containing protein [Saccharophagus sp. K07]MBC6907312.1 stringent starvation protein A [Saccharophagus sp. K07]
MVGTAKRSSAALFSDAKDHYSHRVRIVLAEKNVGVEVITADPLDLPKELSEANPYNSLPTLIDRDLTLYESRVMMEYLDERFPHPPLLPVYPVARAEIRQYIHRVEMDWCPLVDALARDGKNSAEARKELTDSLVAIAPIFADKPFFMSPDFSLLDCCVAPILWRLPAFGIKIPSTRQTQPLLDYMERVFKRDSFVASLSDWEKSIRPASRT